MDDENENVDEEYESHSDSKEPYSEQESEDIINFHKEEMERTKGEEIKNVYFIKK